MTITQQTSQVRFAISFHDLIIYWSSFICTSMTLFW